MKKIWRDPLNRFLIKAVFLFLAWYVLYELWLHPHGTLDLMVIRNIEFWSGLILGAFGFELIPDSEVASIRTIGIDGTSGLWIGDPCNGLTLFALFTGFVLAYPGPWKKKLWFIPIGIFAIHLVNIFRVVGLALIIYYFPDPQVLDFNHTYTFTILVYSFVFYLWYLWANKLSGVKTFKIKKAGT